MSRRVHPEPPWPPVSAEDTGVYIHFPYCARKCPYCDFNSHPQSHERPDESARYARAIVRELDLRAGEYARFAPIRSVYFGGGTPSLWAASEVGDVLRAVATTLPLRPDVEVTLEANPGTVDEARFEGYRAAGINRFSLGVQSFSDAELAWLGRIHDAAAAKRAVRTALATGAGVSLDIIYGLPGQSREAALRSIETALALAPSHISAYTLTVEPGTPFWERAKSKELIPMAEDEQAELIEIISSTLEGAGFERYEISSYAQRGREALHNALYWCGGAYLGLGCGAHSYLPRRDVRWAERRENLRSPEAYLTDIEAGRASPEYVERLDHVSMIADRLWTGMRTRWGIDLASIAEETGREAESIDARVRSTLETLCREGLVRREGHRFVPTTMGFLFNDRIARALLDAVRRSPAPVESPHDAAQ